MAEAFASAKHDEQCVRSASVFGDARRRCSNPQREWALGEHLELALPLLLPLALPLQTQLVGILVDEHMELHAGSRHARVRKAPVPVIVELFDAADRTMDTGDFIPPREVAEGVLYMLQMSEKCSHAEISVDRMS